MRTRLTDLLGIVVPIIQAPMRGWNDADLAATVSQAGGLGSLPCSRWSPEEIHAQVSAIRARTDRPFNLNFFCHAEPVVAVEEVEQWLDRLAGYYAELGLDRPPTSAVATGRAAFDSEGCAFVEELRPPVVSFHFGLPEPDLLERVKATGAVVMSSATTVAEGRWLVDRGCDVVIAQGVEAGGHRGMFLTDDPTTQVGTMALVPLVRDAVDVPVIAAGGIADGRGIAAALALGADGAQLGTAFLRCPEALTGPIHRAALATARDDATVLTNVITGRPARGIVNRLIREVGPMSEVAPAFPLATIGTAALRAAAESRGSSEFSTLWSGQAAPLAREVPAAQLMADLATEAVEVAAELALRVAAS